LIVFLSVNITASEETHLLLNPKRLFEIQNIYIEVLFKYMLYQFGYKETVMRFFGLVKTCLDTIALTSRSDELQRYDDIMEKIIEQTQQTLIS
jgi:hypothetical protein